MDAATELRQTPVARWLRLRPGEIGPAALAAAAFFCLLCAYFIIRPVREAIGLQRGVDELSWLFVGTAVATLLANPLFAALVGRFARHVFIPLTYRFFMLNLAAFYLFLQFFPQGAGIQAGRVFFVWLSLFNLFAVTVFWGLLADGFHLEQGKRLFGIISVGGTLGALAGAALAKSLARPLGAPALLLISIVLLELAVQCLRLLERHFAARRRTSPAQPPPRPALALARRPQETFIDRGALRGITLTLHSPYLMGIAGYIILMAIAATFFYFTQARIVEAATPDRDLRTAIFARIDFWAQLLTLLAQLFLTSRLINRLGVGVALALLPILTVAGLLALWATPALAVLIVAQVLNRAGTYAITRPARETLFTVLSREEKYKAKSLIDTFVYRTGDVTGAGLQSVIAPVFGIPGLAVVAIPLSAIWAILAFALARQQSRRAEAAHAASPDPLREPAAP